jgi:hypothetical protein
MSLATSATRRHYTLHRSVEDRSDGLCKIDGRDFYRITGYDRLPPFLMSIVSDSDLWMYVSSAGALTAGRKNEDTALFPYETDDRLHRARGTTGPFTLLRVTIGQNPPQLWEPFADHHVPSLTQRNLYKSVLNNHLIFEETNKKLGLRFRYQWRSSDRFGWIRTCTLESHANANVAVEVLDGLLNVLPAGAELVTQQRASCLINAYTQVELDPAGQLASRLGIFAMTSLIVDKAEAADSLKANIVWSHGFQQPRVLLCTDQLQSFATGKTVTTESILTGRRGAYLIAGSTEIEPGESYRWDIVADAGRDQFAVETLRQRIGGDAVVEMLEQSIEQADEALLRNLASSDALQISSDRMVCNHHMSNVLFNNMRGGVVAGNGAIATADLQAFMTRRNKHVAVRCREFFDKLPRHQVLADLLKAARQQNDADLLRLCYEYLPITFSRRHGDPSRPWNRFSIAVKDEQGNPILDYQGNWRDIFQNWEAMCASFPDFIESVIAKFVNASTIDGFNPYRVTRDGIEWESTDPHDPWANIGYWGDHQIVYLLRLAEMSRRYHGQRLANLLEARIFSYANVPYRLKPYAALIQDRWNTIEFDHELDRRTEQRVKDMGTDAKLLTDSNGDVIHVTLLEKLLVPLLSKLSNLVVDGGIWMNTQRPEWNDANNALVGNGISMVTLCYLRRYVGFLQELVTQSRIKTSSISARVQNWLVKVCSVLRGHEDQLQAASISDVTRRQILDQLGATFEEYRNAVYPMGLIGEAELSRGDLDSLLSVALKYLDHGIRANRRADGLFHAYNLLHFSADPKGLGIDRLPEMLEGQVAVLSSGTLSSAEAIALLEAMFASSLYRGDQQSFMLYPNRKLPGFLDRNTIGLTEVKANPLLAELIAAGNRALVSEDASGHFRFTGSPRSSKDIAAALDRLAEQPRWSAVVETHRQSILDLYESVVNHRSFTGRSGTMFGYEGLGCIYWHMVAKLLLATQECFFRAIGNHDCAAEVRALADLYYRVRAGLSFNKTADVYGAFPLDPYSHTPAHCGAQQPGMTGQVKEEIITRAGELGVTVIDGCIAFRPALLRRSEFLDVPSTWHLIGLDGQHQQLPLASGSLGFTLCQTPVIYSLGDAPGIGVAFADGRSEFIEENTLSDRISHEILQRTAAVARIQVTIQESCLCALCS